MKKRGNSCDYTAAKNAELVRVFKRLVSEATIVDLDKIFRQVAASKASRFFISEERAYELVKAFRETGLWHISNRLRVEMMEAINELCLKLERSNPGLSLRDAVYEAVNHRAPKFYLTARSCRTLIYATIHDSILSSAKRRLNLA